MAAQNIVSSTILDDTSGNITYAGNTPWTIHANQNTSLNLYGNGDTFTGEQYATATVKFYGNAIEYWGNQGNYHGPCQITLDGSIVGTANSHADIDVGPPIILYSINSLDLTDHTLVVTVLGNAYPNTCEVDRFVVNVTSDVTYTSSYVYTGPGSQPTGAAVPNPTHGGNGNNNGNNNNGNNTGNTNGSSSKSSPPVAAIAGAVGGAAAIALLLVAWWLWRRSHKSKTQKTRPPPVLRKGSVNPYLAPTSPPIDAEKSPFQSLGAGAGAGGGNTRPEFAHQPTSYVSSSSPPASSYGASTPAPSIGYNQYNYAPVPTGSPAPLGQYPSPPTSPGPPNVRPTSIISSAPTTTMSFYTSAAPTTEASFPGGFVPQQYQANNIAPVWATGSTATATTSPSMSITSIPGPPQQQHSLPPGAMASAPAAVQPGPDEFPREKATYTGRRDPVSAGESSSGKAPLPTDTKATPAVAAAAAAPAAGSSSQPGPSSTGPARSGSGDVLSPVIPDNPPPAYQF